VIVVHAPPTHVFIPPQEIVLNSSRPTQVFTPSARVTRAHGGTNPTATTSIGNLPFTGSQVGLGLVAGFALLCGGALLLVRREAGELERALDHQAAALEELTER